VIVSVWDSDVYIEEMDVLSSHGPRGIGTQLLTHVSDWASQQGFRSVILSTFTNIPWNGPFYRKNGFTDLEPNEWTPKMHQIRDAEVRHGLSIEARVFMKKELLRS